MALNAAKLAEKAKGYEPPKLSAFEETLVSNWGVNPPAVETVLREHFGVAAEELGVDLEKWVGEVIHALAERKLSPFAIPNALAKIISERGMK